MCFKKWLIYSRCSGMGRATLACRDQSEGWAKPAEPGLPVSAYLFLQLACLPMRKAQAMKGKKCPTHQSGNSAISRQHVFITRFIQVHRRNVIILLTFWRRKECYEMTVHLFWSDFIFLFWLIHTRSDSHFLIIQPHTKIPCTFI